MQERPDIIWYDSLDSTNLEALRRMDCLDNMSVIAARWQTAGRGQRNNVWFSSDRDLACSIVLRFPEDDSPDIASSWLLSEIAALSVASWLAEQGLDPRIKWPNDIYIGDRKICGILMDNGIQGKRLVYSIIGIGVNIGTTAFGSGLPNPTSLALERSGGAMTPQQALDGIVDRFMDYSGLSDECDDGGSIHAMYNSLLYGKDRTMKFRDSTGIISGQIIGCRKDGKLEVKIDGSEEIRQFAFKEVEFLLALQS